MLLWLAVKARFEIIPDCAFEQVGPSQAIGFISGCVEHLAHSLDLPEAYALAHALLDHLPALTRVPLDNAALQKAAALFWDLLDAGHARLAVKVAQVGAHVAGSFMQGKASGDHACILTCGSSTIMPSVNVSHDGAKQSIPVPLPLNDYLHCPLFPLVALPWQGMGFSEETLWQASQSHTDSEMLPDITGTVVFEAELASRILALMDDTKAMSAAVNLAMQFTGLRSRHLLPDKVVLQRLVEAGQLPLACTWACSCDRSTQVIAPGTFFVHGLYAAALLIR